MNTRLRKRRPSRFSIGPYRRYELLTGHVEYTPSYSGYGDGTSTDLTKFIGPTMYRDWAANRTALLAFWESGMSDAEAFPHDALPWLCFGPRDRPPWGVEHLD